MPTASRSPVAPVGLQGEQFMPHRVLVVDDEPDIVELVTLLLESAGYEVAAASTGQVAIEKVAAERFQLVLLDVSLPGVDGIEVAAKLRASSDGALKVAFHTAMPEPWVREQFDRYDMFFSKPVAGDVLLRGAHSLLAGAPAPT